MASPTEVSAPGSREISPITQPPSPAAVEIEHHQATSERSLSVSTDGDDNVSYAASHDASFAAAPPPPGDTAGEMTEDVDISGVMDTTGAISALLLCKADVWSTF